MSRTGKERVAAVEAKRPPIRTVPRVIVTGGETTPEIDRLVRAAIDEQRARERGSGA